MKAYQDRSLSQKARTEDLLARMTWAEKIAQMQLTPQIDQVLVERGASLGDMADIWPDGLGASYTAKFFDPALFNQMQEYFVKKTRLGIPLILMGESLHGVLSPEATVFPQAIGMGATFNQDLIRQMATEIGKEARKLGIRETYAPNLDLARDPRWGRTEENYGEDPYLTAQLGKAYIEGLQSQGVASSPKHYVAHGSPEGGINLAPVHCGERELRDTMLVPFATAIKEAGAMSLMPAYSEWDGIPVHASRFLMTDLLRGELGFNGFTVSDFGAITMLHSFHKVAPDALTAGKMALNAGIDMEAPNVFGFGPELLAAAQGDPVLQAQIDLAVSRILLAKFQLGLFDEPYIDLDQPYQLRNEDNLVLSRQVARESLVLLENKAKLLPLDPGLKVALAGPNAAEPQLGDYTHREALGRSVSLYDALKASLGERLLYSKGCSLARGSKKDLKEAARLADQADVAILVLGDSSNYHGGIGWGDDAGGNVVTCGEGFDSHDLLLPKIQRELLEEVAATGTPVVLILTSGRPYDLSWESQIAQAIIQAWYPGEAGGLALRDILFGQVSPSGRLPISFPQSVGHIPAFYNHKVSARGYYKKPGSSAEPGRDYVFASPDPLYPFGHGLSYTSFKYSDLKVSPEKGAAKQEFMVEVKVKNTGSRQAQEAVLLYLRDCYRRITPEIRQLRGFSKIDLKPGEEKTVQFSLAFADLAFINEKMEPEVEPGSFEVTISDLSAEFMIV